MNRRRIRLGGTVAMASTFLTLSAAAWSAAGAQDGPPPPPPPPPPTQDQPTDLTDPGPTTRPLPPLAAGERRVSVTFADGHDTDGRDHGRPVVLIAAALAVPADVFRETFTHVHPAGPGQGGPTDAEARANKAALMAGLSKYGVTDARLNAVSNYYRYVRGRHGLWRHREAMAFAVVRNGTVVRFDIADAGAGYTTPPAVTVDGFPDLSVTAALSFGTDLATNGSIDQLAIGNR
jgi:hypothetical protein